MFAGETLVSAGGAAHNLNDTDFQEVNMYHIPSNLKNMLVSYILSSKYKCFSSHFESRYCVTALNDISINYTLFLIIMLMIHCCCIWYKTAVINLEGYSPPCFSSHVKP